MAENDRQPDHRSSDYRYLETLSFSPELRKSWLNFFVSNFRVVVLLIVLLTAWGVYSYITLPRESNPEVKIPIAVVTTIYPGASPADVEELITKKVETGIAGIRGINKISSDSSNSFSAITVEFDADEDLDDAIRRLRDKVTTIQNELPGDAQDSQVMEISLDDEPILTLMLTGPYDGFIMRQYADDLKDELEKIPGIRQINVSGGDEHEFEVAYDPDKLLFYGVSADQANQAIVATNRAIPAGNFDGEKFVYPIRTDARVFDADAIGGVVVSQTEAGSVVLIKDIARVEEKAIKRTNYSRFSVNGEAPQNSVTLSVIKRTGSSIINTVDAAKETANSLVGTFPPGMRYDTMLDMAEFVRQDFDQLSHDFLLTLLLVSIVLFLIVGLKEAFVAGLAIPLVFFATFGSLLLLGMTLNFLSMFSLILALGLLVDDAIVVVSATKQYLRTGKFTPEEAVLLVLNDFKVVLTTTTLTTVWAFLPLLFSTGIMGEYIKSIPITVSITLMSSLFIALMINHPLAAVLERIRLTKRTFIVIEVILLAIAGVALALQAIPGYIVGTILTVIVLAMIWWYERGGRAVLESNAVLAEREWYDDELIKKKLREQGSHEDTNFTSRLIHGIIHFNSILPTYEKYLRRLVETRRRRLGTLGVTLVLFIIAVLLPVTGIVKSEFFPESDMDYVYIDIRTPVGSRIEQTDSVVRTVEEKLLSYEEIKSFSTVVGRRSPLSGGSLRDSSNVASITITLKKKEERTQKSYEIAERMRLDMPSIPNTILTVSTPQGGPPSGAAFEARVKGDDFAELDRIAHDLEDRLASVPGIINTDVSLKDAAPEYTFALDPVKLEQYSLNATYVGSILRMAIAGLEVSTVIRGGDEIDIVAKFDEAKIPTLEALQNIQIINFQKQPVYLKDVAQIELRPSLDTITRVDQKRTVLLSAGITPQTTAPQALADFQSRIADYELPAGYSIVYGGQNEQNTDSVVSVIRAMLIAIVLIVSTLIIQFNSFRQAFIVLVTIPLALIGVFFGMALFNVNLSFPGLIGILALFGIVVKNAIILVDKINLNLRSGIPFFESIVDAGKSRLEAIFITSICTIFGILPITLSNELWRSLGGAVIFGLSLSSFLTLFIIPALYLTLMRDTRKPPEAISA